MIGDGANMTKILFFSSTSCGPCNAMKRIINDDLVKELNIEFKDIQENIEDAIKYQVAAVPTFVKVDEEGNKQASRSGILKIEDLRTL